MRVCCWLSGLVCSGLWLSTACAGQLPADSGPDNLTIPPLYEPRSAASLFEPGESSGSATAPEDGEVPLESAVPPGVPVTAVPPVPSPSANAEIERLTGEDAKQDEVSLTQLTREPYRNYRTEESSWTWLPGSGQDFGWLSFEGTTYQPRGNNTGFGGNFGLHLLGGPGSSPLPPRLYDFAFGFQSRKQLSYRFSYDVAASVGVYSDFEDSAREGVRFPSHATGIVHVNESSDVVFGLDYLDRDDISMLPVFGVSLHDVISPNLRLDLVFPRPRVDYLLSDDRRLYLAGRLGGGTWDIEFPDESNQVMTYRDYRLVLGVERSTEDFGTAAWELGWVFGRSLEFRGVPGHTDFQDAFLLRWVWTR